MTWLNGPLLALDTETTGTDPESARIVQVCVGMSQRPGHWEPWTRILNPGVPIPTEATHVHGITDARAAEEGMDPREALAHVHLTLSQAAERGVPVVAHNAAYDQLILDRVMLDLSYEGSFTIGRPILCTKELTTPICKLPSPWGSGFKWPNLQEAHRFFFNEDFTGAHGALADVKACARVFFEGRARNLWV